MLALSSWIRMTFRWRPSGLRSQFRHEESRLSVGVPTHMRKEGTGSLRETSAGNSRLLLVIGVDLVDEEPAKTHAHSEKKQYGGTAA